MPPGGTSGLSRSVERNRAAQPCPEGAPPQAAGRRPVGIRLSPQAGDSLHGNARTQPTLAMLAHTSRIHITLSCTKCQIWVWVLLRQQRRARQKSSARIRPMAHACPISGSVRRGTPALCHGQSWISRSLCSDSLGVLFSLRRAALNALDVSPTAGTPARRHRGSDPSRSRNNRFHPSRCAGSGCRSPDR